MYDIIISMINRVYTFDQHLKELLKDPKFKNEWDKTATERQIAGELIKKRLAKNMSQRSLAKKLNTSQAAVSRIETMSGNPSLAFLKRIAAALGSKLIVKFE